MSNAIRFLWVAPVLFCTQLSVAQIEYGPALVGPNFDDQPWLGQPGYDNPGPAPQYVPKERVVYGPAPKKDEQESASQEGDNQQQTAQTPTNGKQPQQTQGNQGQQQSSQQPQTDQQRQTQAAQQPRTSFRFGRLRNEPTFQPGNAQMHHETTTGQRPETNFNEQRFQQIPRLIRSRPGFQSGHFISQPQTTQQPGTSANPTQGGE